MKEYKYINLIIKMPQHVLIRALRCAIRKGKEIDEYIEEATSVYTITDKEKKDEE